MTAASATASIAPHPSACANCGAGLSGPFCAACGQSIESLERPLWRLVEQLLESLLDFDARGLRTLRLMCVPGALTDAYLAGRRMAQVPPVRFFIFVSVFFYLVLATSGLAIVQFGVPDAETAAKVLQAAGDKAHTAFTVTLLEPRQPVPATPIQLPGVDRLAQSDAGYGLVRRIGTGLQHAGSDPERLNRTIEELLPKTMVVLVPGFALILAVLYSRRFFIDHLVFALHIHVFLFLLFSVAILAAVWLHLPVLSFWAVAGLFALYLVPAMRRVYRRGWGATLVKAALLLALYGIMFGTTMAALLLVGLGET